MFIRLVFFYCCWLSTFIATCIAILKILHWLIMGKGKIGLYCYLTEDILIKVLQIFFFPIVAMATERLKCWLKAFIAIYLGERVWPMSLWFRENHENVAMQKYPIVRYLPVLLFFIAVSMCFRKQESYRRSKSVCLLEVIKSTETEERENYICVVHKSHQVPYLPKLLKYSKGLQEVFHVFLSKF